ncbi:MAG: outer membrane beta-barrel protein [Bryobacteraceae bacterium]
MRSRLSRKLVFCCLPLFACWAAAGQDNPGPPATPGDAAAARSPFAIGPINISGTVDGYYSFNNNHPASRVNTQHNFDVSANSFDLNFAKMKLEMAPDPVGFVFDFGFGTGMEVFSGGEPGNPNVVGPAGVVSNQFLNHITQAYMSVKPKTWGGVQLDFGKFYTSAGAELTETYTNWNYSRSLLFTNGPFYHFGARVSAPVGSHFVAGAQIVNGWNNVFDNNSGKTAGLTGAFNFNKVTWANAYYVGPENSQIGEGGAFLSGPAGKGLRNFFDTALTVTPSDNAAFYVNYDYGSNKIKGASVNPTWWALAFAGKLGPKKLYFAPRFEIYSDKNGFITGAAQKIKEVTTTLNYEFTPGFMTKLEYRHDWSNVAYFPAGASGLRKTQDTVLIGLVMYFPFPK